jgi:hypothetical protein
MTHHIVTLVPSDDIHGMPVTEAGIDAANEAEGDRESEGCLSRGTREARRPHVLWQLSWRTETESKEPTGRRGRLEALWTARKHSRCSRVRRSISPRQLARTFGRAAAEVIRTL